MPTFQDAIDLLQPALQGAPATGWRGFLEAWLDFSEWRLLIRVTVSILVSVGLAAAIAFHPRTHGRATTVAEIEAPKTLLLYALIGTVVAQLVVVLPSMALVVFGIGGLLRFRTNVGAADDTGQVILVTIIGLACGLSLFPLAALGTGLAWALLWMLESSRAREVVVGDLAPGSIRAARRAYVEALEASGLEVVSSRANRRFDGIVVTTIVPTSLTLDDLVDRVASIPEELRGLVTWDKD